MLNDKHTEMTSMTGDLQRLAADIRNLQENLSAKAGTSIRKPVAESHVVQQPVMKQNAVVQPMTETIDVQPEPEVQVNRFQEIQEPEQKTEKPETADAQDVYKRQEESEDKIVAAAKAVSEIEKVDAEEIHLDEYVKEAEEMCIRDRCPPESEEGNLK